MRKRPRLATLRPVSREEKWGQVWAALFLVLVLVLTIVLGGRSCS